MRESLSRVEKGSGMSMRFVGKSRVERLVASSKRFVLGALLLTSAMFGARAQVSYSVYNVTAGSSLGTSISTLQAAVTACNVAATNDSCVITLIGGNDVLPSAVTIANGRRITITSDNGQRIIAQPNLARHIIVEGELTLKNIVLAGLERKWEYIDIPTLVYVISDTNGGIYVGNYGKLIMKDGSVIRGCYAAYGGGVRSSGTLIMTGGKITDNTAVCNALPSTYYMAGDGGGVYIDAGTFTMTDGEISGNHAMNAHNGSASGQGGGVYLSADATFTFLGGTIGGSTFEKANHAFFGGGIWSDGNLTMGDVAGVHPIPAKISGDSAKGSGGGIYMHSSAIFTFYNGEISNNKATNQNIPYGLLSAGNGGGGIFSGGTVIMHNGSVFNNSVGLALGQAGGGGGGINSIGTFTMYDGEFYNNNAVTGSGGGMYIREGTFTMINGKVYENIAGGGGGILLSGNGSMTGGEINNNRASMGGGLAVTSTWTSDPMILMRGGIFSMTEGCTIRGNIAEIGGGVYFDGDVFTMMGGIIDSNIAVESNGGGLYISIIHASSAGRTYKSNSVFIMNGGYITKNSALGNGGGIYLRSGDITIDGGFITDDTAMAGGGIYLDTIWKEAVLTFKNGEISGNIATGGDGGGVFDGDRFTMDGGKITNNEAENGGGVYLSNCVFTMNGGEISKNYANQFIPKIGIDTTGFLYVFKMFREDMPGFPDDNTILATLGISDYEQININHVGLIFDILLSVEPIDPSIEDVVVVDMLLNVFGIDATSFDAGMLSYLGIADNSELTFGHIEMILIASGKNIDDVLNGFYLMVGPPVISEPIVAGGGGVYVDKKSNFLMTSGKIVGNTAAADGGGILNASIVANAVSITNAIITDDTAGGNGGGIWTTYSADGYNALKTDGVTFARNKAVKAVDWTVNGTNISPWIYSQIYEQQILNTVLLSDIAPYNVVNLTTNNAYNNYDINYEGTPIVVTVRYYTGVIDAAGNVTSKTPLPLTPDQDPYLSTFEGLLKYNNLRDWNYTTGTGTDWVDYYKPVMHEAGVVYKNGGLGVNNAATDTITKQLYGAGFNITQDTAFDVVYAESQIQVFEIWNWDDLSKVMQKQNKGVTQFKVMQNIGVPGQNNFGDGSDQITGSGESGKFSPYYSATGVDSTRKYGWYGYEGFEGLSGATFAAGTQTDTIHGWMKNEGWIPIGENVPFNATARFSADFNGNNKTITGAWIHRTGADYQGLFGCISTGANVYNLIIALGNGDAELGIVTTGNYVGGLTGCIYAGTISGNITVASGNVTGGDYVGGIIGSIGVSTVSSVGVGIIDGILKTENTVVVTGVQYVGGIAGSITGTPTLTHSEGNIYNNAAKVLGTIIVGGIAGNYTATTADRVFDGGAASLAGSIQIIQTGVVDHPNSTPGGSFGGIFGQMGVGIGGTTPTLQNVTRVQTDSVKGGYNVGGLVGCMQDGVIKDCTNNGVVQSDKANGNYSNLGGIVGEFVGTMSGTVTNGATAQLIIGPNGGDRVGGIIGSIRTAGVRVRANAINNANINVNVQYVGGIVGAYEGILTGGLAANVTYTNNGNICGAGYVGGIFGNLEAGSSLVSIMSGTTVSSSRLRVINNGAISMYLGAIGSGFGSFAGNFAVGSGAKITLENYVNSQPVSGYDNVGGIAGIFANSSSNTTITNSMNTGSVVASHNNAGGIAGSVASGTGSRTSEIINCYNLGDVSALTNAGGVAGLITNGTHTANYNAGKVTGGNGFVGTVTGTPVFTDCYYDKTTSQTASSGDISIIGVTTTDFIMNTPAVFKSSPWKIDISQNANNKYTYPYLTWQESRGLSNTVDFTAVSHKADSKIAVPGNTNVTFTSPSGAKVFNPFGANFSTTIASATATTTTANQPISIGMMSASDIVLFRCEQPCDTAPAITLNSSDTIQSCSNVSGVTILGNSFIGMVGIAINKIYSNGAGSLSAVPLISPFDITYTPAFPADSGKIITITVTTNIPTGTCIPDTARVRIKFNTPPKLTSNTLMDEICSGNMVHYTATADSVVTFSWARVPKAGITSSGTGSGSGASIDETLYNSTSSDLTVTYKITMTTLSSCAVTQDVLVTVKPKVKTEATIRIKK